MSTAPLSVPPRLLHRAPAAIDTLRFSTLPGDGTWLRVVRPLSEDACWDAAEGQPVGKYDMSTTTLGVLLEDPEVVAILERHAPGITSNPMVGMASAMPAAEAVSLASSMIGPRAVAAITEEVSAL